VAAAILGPVDPSLAEAYSKADTPERFQEANQKFLLGFDRLDFNLSQLFALKRFVSSDPSGSLKGLDARIDARANALRGSLPDEQFRSQLRGAVSDSMVPASTLAQLTDPATTVDAQRTLAQIAAIGGLATPPFVEFQSKGAFGVGFRTVLVGEQKRFDKDQFFQALRLNQPALRTLVKEIAQGSIAPLLQEQADLAQDLKFAEAFPSIEADPKLLQDRIDLVNREIAQRQQSLGGSVIEENVIGILRAAARAARGADEDINAALEPVMAGIAGVAERAQTELIDPKTVDLGTQAASRFAAIVDAAIARINSVIGPNNLRLHATAADTLSEASSLLEGLLDEFAAHAPPDNRVLSAAVKGYKVTGKADIPFEELDALQMLEATLGGTAQ